MASTCSTSLVPMPNASAPNAPCVAVWLSPQTTVMPGCVSPSSGPMTCTMPCRSLWIPRQRMPNSAQLASSCASCFAAISSTIGSERSVVGMLWSAVAMVRSGRRTLRPRVPQALESLRRSDFVHQVQVDKNQRWRTGLFVHDVGIPEFFDDGLGHNESTPEGPVF